MGQLTNGKWEETDISATDSKGSFQRRPSAWRDWITADGSSGYKAESGRYHLYVAYACPWAHRTLLFRTLKGLEPHISVDVVHPFMGRDGWHFATDFAGATGDSLFGLEYLHQIYTRSDADATTRVTVPVLWDKETGRIVSNESSDIIRMFNSAFDGITGNTDDYWPQDMRPQIEEVNERIYHTLNNGVYKSGFARSQSAYDAAVSELFATMDWLEERLATRRYLMGDRLTEADWRLYVTLRRFDAVYHTHFKCNRTKLSEFENLWGYSRALHQMPGIAETTDMAHVTQHYYQSHTSINPFGIVPIGPQPDWMAPHERGSL